MPRKWLFNDYVHVAVLVGVVGVCAYAFQQGTAVSWLQAIVDLASRAAHALLPT